MENVGNVKDTFVKETLKKRGPQETFWKRLRRKRLGYGSWKRFGNVDRPKFLNFWKRQINVV